MKTLIVNATVQVLDGRTAPQEALVLDGTRIAGVGSTADMTGLAGTKARRVDVGGATVMPGIINTHPHVLHFAAMKASLLDLTDCVNHADIVERIRNRAATTPKGQWILCTPIGEPHYFVRRSYRDLEERRLPDKYILDRATTDHPVLIQAWAPIQPAICAFNSAGLKAIHVSDSVPDVVCDVRFDKDFQGRLMGTVRGAVTNYLNFDPYWGQIQSKIMMQIGSTAHNFGAITPVLLKAAINEYHARGVTAGYECHVMSATDIAAYQHLRDANELTMRVHACLEPEAGFHHFPHDPPPLAITRERMQQGLAMTRTDDDLLRISGLSHSIGGPCSAGHFMTYEPYPDPYGRPTYGLPTSPEENLAAFVDFCASNGARMNIVVGSYPEQDQVLDLCEAAAAKHGIRNAWILQHAVLVNPAQLRRYKAMGFKVGTNMSFTWGKGDIYAARLGKHILRDLSPLRGMLNAGLQVSLGSDWGPDNYFEHMRFAQTHEFCGSGYRNDGPDQVVNRAEAVAMWTREAAGVMGWEGIGTLEPGNLADVVIVDRDPLTCGIDQLAATRVLRTMVGGNIVHDSAELPGVD